MGVQSVAARQDNRPGVTTVVFTSTLTSIVIALTGAILRSPHRLAFAAKRQMFMFLAYGIGALAGGFLTLHAIDAIPFLPPAAALLGLWLHLVGSPQTGSPQTGSPKSGAG